MKRCRKLYYDSRFSAYMCSSTSPCYRKECSPANLFRSAIRLVGNYLEYEFTLYENKK